MQTIKTMKTPRAARSLLGVLAAIFLLFAAPPARAEAGPPPPTPQFSEKTAEKLPRLKELLDASDFPAILALVDEILAAAEPGSFDQAIFIQMRGQVLLNLKQYAAAIPFLEQSLQLGEARAWLDSSSVLNTLQTLSQLYAQEAAEAKDNPSRQKNYQLARDRIQRWLTLSKRPSAEILFYIATLLYSEATLDPANPDLEKLRQARDKAAESLLLRRTPDEQTRVLIVAAQQQLGQLAETADTLELLAAARPANALYWRQLFATYTGLASEAKLPSETRRLQLRALLTLERARAHGHPDTPQDTFNTVALYFALQQYEHAALHLEKGLASGVIPSTRQNWELLSSAWQQQRAVPRAIAALERAVKALPRDGELEVSLARLLHAEERLPSAYRHALQAVSPEHQLDHPAHAWFLAAYLAYELQKFEDADRLLKTAATQRDAKPEEIARLQAAIQSALNTPKPAEPAKNT